jgi:hypothetical protein
VTEEIATMCLVRAVLLLGLTLVLAAGCGGSTSRSPGERLLVFVRGASRAEASVWIARVDGSHARRLARGASAVVSPDGDTVAVGRPGGIFLVPSAGGRERRLIAKRLRPQAWSADSKWLVAASPMTVAVVERSSGRLRVVARGPIYGVDVSPDGDELVYSRAPRTSYRGLCGDQFDLYITQFEGGPPSRLTHDGLSAFPVWGASRIAFAHFPGPSMEDCRAPGIWTIDEDGSDPEPILKRAPPEISIPGSGHYGLEPVGWQDDERVLVGIRGDYGSEGGVLDTKTHRLRRLGGFADEASFDGRFLVGADEAQGTVTITRVADARHTVVEDACCADWNR